MLLHMRQIFVVSLAFYCCMKGVPNGVLTFFSAAPQLALKYEKVEILALLHILIVKCFVLYIYAKLTKLCFNTLYRCWKNEKKKPESEQQCIC